ncbi:MULTISPECIES: MFS transporter [unclassified Streptomyces]|uniref:MFS transporter n=1 Tax=unclassified Streptomyces TaxID=2593676 RepID=UPI0029B79EC4|nr:MULTISPECIES: MFS transporter [unclassified Streptomyces]MDX3771460.1 MFS transporter [Streptomyces sp. AK08-01B]MDX3819003.1 MFS transporter [Streptomyces sp. AK08-01A]
MSAAPPVVELAPIVERQRASRSWLLMYAVCCLITCLDGFDFQILSFAATYIRKDFALTETQLGTLGTVGLFGTMIGALIMGYLADRIGRRPIIALSVVGFGLFMLGFAYADTYGHLIALRFVSGLFLGGVLPLTWALAAEYAPRRFRVTAVSIIMAGYTLGGAAGGPVSNWLVPEYGWRSVFVVGGVCSLLTVFAMLALLPESVKFLALKARPRGDERIARILARLQPDLAIEPGTRFITGDPQLADHGLRFTPAQLFRGHLMGITPLLWLVYLLSSALIYFMVFWTPMINERMGFSVSAAATIAACASVAGAVGQLFISRFVDRKGAGTILWMPLAAVVCMLVLGTGVLGPAVYVAFVIGAKMFINSGHGGITSIAGTFYPTEIRANGAAWASSVAKVGAMAGPWLGGVILDAGLGARGAFTLFSVCPAVMVLVLFALGRVQRRLPAEAEGALSAELPEAGLAAARPAIQT